MPKDSKQLIETQNYLILCPRIYKPHVLIFIRRPLNEVNSLVLQKPLNFKNIEEHVRK